uniref:dUTPase domain-containing protein n=1 Tax=Ascaris lumbricoides TaxID=6252 RepID=A0A0M3I2J6_ASCLU
MLFQLSKRYGFIDGGRLGNVFFPITAILTGDKCIDIREKFQDEDEVIFTSQKQDTPCNKCNYIATPIVLKNELITVPGEIEIISNRFAYAEASDIGQIFVPFSAKNEAGQEWHGEGGVSEMSCTLTVIFWCFTERCTLNVPSNFKHSCISTSNKLVVNRL